MNQQETLYEDEDDEYKPKVVESRHPYVKKEELEMVRRGICKTSKT